jgi:L-amino acid N-acyltransferase YncA
MIRPATPGDAAAIADIYNYYVTETVVTFEEQPVSVTEMTERIAEIAQANLPWLVCEHDGRVTGFAYASKWKGRCAYRHSAESTVYLERGATGRGIGRLLYAGLIEQLRTRNLHAVLGGIALPNEASVALHEKMGFTKVAHFKEVGHKLNRWVDVAYWQLLI